MIINCILVIVAVVFMMISTYFECSTYICQQCCWYCYDYHQIFISLSETMAMAFTASSQVDLLELPTYTCPSIAD